MQYLNEKKFDFFKNFSVIKNRGYGVSLFRRSSIPYALRFFARKDNFILTNSCFSCYAERVNDYWIFHENKRHDKEKRT